VIFPGKIIGTYQVGRSLLWTLLEPWGQEPAGFRTHGQAGSPLTCVSPAQRTHTPSLPSWSCGFDSRRPLRRRTDIASRFST